MKINKLFVPTLSLALIVVLILGACSSPAPTPKPDLPAIRIGINQWVGWGALFIARDKGFFAAEGAKVELVNLDSSNAGNTAFATKQVDANTTTLSDTLAQASAKIPLQVVWIFDTSMGADVFVANSTIQSPADLKGKRIGLSYGTFGHIFVLSGLAKYGISRSDVTIVDVAGEDVPQALAAGKIDAGHTWDPHLAEALKNGAHVMFTSADTPGIINDVLEFRTDMLQNRPDDVKAIFRAIQDASDYWAKNPDDGNQIVGKAIGVAASDMPALLKTDHIWTLAENQAALDPNNPQSLTKMVKTISDFFISEKVITQAPDAQTVLNGTFAQALSVKQ